MGANNDLYRVPLRRDLTVPWAIPDFASRCAWLRELTAPLPHKGFDVLAEEVDAFEERLFERHVEPVIEASWPELHSEAPAMRTLLKKIRIHARFYAGWPHLAYLVCRRPPPFVAEAVEALGDGGDEAARRRCARLYFDGLERENEPINARIIQVSAMTPLIDHVIDDGMSFVDLDSRPQYMREILTSTREPPSGPEGGAARLLRALCRLIDSPTMTLGPVRFCEKHVRTVRGEVDPTGLCFRAIGPAALVKGFDFTGLFDEPHLASWGYDIGWISQMMDDLLDAEYDRDVLGIPTPILTGGWTDREIVEQWRRTLASTEDATRRAPHATEALVRLWVDTFIERMRLAVPTLVEIR